jgi:hypothetical protein
MMATGKLLAEHKFHEGQIHTLPLSPDGTLLASGRGWDRTHLASQEAGCRQSKVDVARTAITLRYQGLDHRPIGAEQANVI